MITEELVISKGWVKTHKSIAFLGGVYYSLWEKVNKKYSIYYNERFKEWHVYASPPTLVVKLDL